MPSSHGAFGDDAFGRRAEKVARFFGTPRYILAQSVLVVIWIALNSIGIAYRWDPYPFILLNLAFSTQAAYAAPLILLAQTRQADRDKIHGDMIDKRHTGLERALKSETEKLVTLLRSNTEITQQDKQLTEEVVKLTKEIHTLLQQRGTAA
ncbi:MAG: hypothetical protein QOE43_261 [Gaiellaceae bacterium]|nr:hypothetical protein [Gaiellaceae bacterium]